MPVYGMGDAIREMRIRLGYTQEELAFGICTTSTLSKIENGKTAISKHIFEAIYSRMPGIDHVWISYDTKTEMQRSKLCKQILLYLIQRRMDEAKIAIERYHRIRDKKSPFCGQFELYVQAVYLAMSDGSWQEILHKLKQALSLTMPCYEKRLREQKKTILLSYGELHILSNIGIAYAKRKEIDRSLRILCFLKDYLENQNLDLSEVMAIYPMIVGNLAWVLAVQGRFEEAVKQCDSGVKICCLTDKYTLLPHLLCTKARCLTASGCPVIAKKCKWQAKTIFGISENFRGYGSFEEFYKARDPIFVTFQ